MGLHGTYYGQPPRDQGAPGWWWLVVIAVVVAVFIAWGNGQPEPGVVAVAPVATERRARLACDYEPLGCSRSELDPGWQEREAGAGDGGEFCSPFGC